VRISRIHGPWILAFLCTLGALGCASSGSEEIDPRRQDPPRPNVIILLADDQGWGDVGYHAPELRTPHIDALAREGVELDTHYVQPQCTPTRVALLTGRYPSRFGPHCTTASNERALPPGTPTMASMFQDLGYETALVGKWHLGSKPEWGPNHHGFDTSYGSLAGAVGMYDHRYRLGSPFERTWHRDHVFIEDEGHSTDLLAREAVAFVTKKRSRPFFLYVPFHAVHTPIVEQDEHWHAINAHIEHPDRRRFAAALSHLDDAVGQIIRALEASGQRENTLIVYSSDNGGLTRYPGGNYPPPDPALAEGYSSNEPLRGAKTQAFEGGIRVPAFVSWPGVLQPRKVTATLHVVDWMPTLAALLDWKPPVVPEWDGRDVWSQLGGDEAPERQLYWRWGKTWDALRLGDWKIVRRNRRKEGTWTAGTWQLYDLGQDPSETTDLASEYPERVDELAQRFTAEEARDG
jgi:arylsulfatase A-like enzyme